jgi:phospholipid-transporting ATPase
MVKNKKAGNASEDNFAWGKKNTHHFRERHIQANENRLDYPDNRIRTSKYTFLNFLPKNMMLQFSKMANIYFLVIGLLSIIRPISTTDGVPLIFIPLAIIILVSAVKDIVEDWKRHASDNEENIRPCQVFRDGKFVTVRWRDLRCGNIIKIKENEFFPADVLVLKSSGKKGAVYIETKNLDGETNLKYKQANKEIAEEFQTDAQLSSANNKFDYEPPNVYLYNFTGAFHTKNAQVPLNEQNFILRGCSLKNTGEITGLVAYTGHHTKIMMNSIKAKAKFSKLEQNMNKQIRRVFLVQFLFCLFGGFYAATWYELKRDNLDYLRIPEDASKDNTYHYNFFVRFGNWLLLFTNFVPISLLVTLEMVRLFQGMKMTADPEMTSSYDHTKTTVQSSNLNEELGQIDYIFSDKTGTLTKNLMEFKNCCVKGKIYGDKKDITDISHLPVVSNVDFRDSSLFMDMEDPNSPYHDDLQEFLIQLSICHTIITEEKEGKLVYNASSPDELALINFAKLVGAEYTGMDDDNNMTMMYKKREFKFKLLHVLEFNSTRKRMSVVVQTPEGKVIVYTKGADSILFARMNSNDPIIHRTQENLSAFANIGLRTLVLAKRVIDFKQYEEWAKRYHQASILLQNREEAMMELQSEIESNLVLVGATAIEDKLQDDVDITISRLKESGIKVWVLTGDKVETAINIGFSCKLLTEDLHQLLIVETTEEEVKQSIAEKLKAVEGINPDEKSKLALIISGEALIIAAKCDIAKDVIQIAQYCNAVLACRVSPKQKQQIVSMVREQKPRATTLAIGDGANDVNMIIAAHVGVGIKGVEGQQAARASDFAIGEFKILRKLVYFHGREAYRRNSYLILYNFYKNMVVVVPQFWFAFYCGFSGTTIYDQVIFQGFNLFYASIPIIIYAIFDYEYPAKTLMNRAILYVQGPADRLFNTKKFWGWIAMGIFESFIITYWSYHVFGETFSTPDSGRDINLIGVGMLVHTQAVFVVNAKIATISNLFNPLNIFFMIGSCLFYLILFYLGNLVIKMEVYGLFGRLFGSADFWIAAIFGSVVAYSATLAYGRHNYLVRTTLQNKVSPEEIEINNLLANTPNVQLEIPKFKEDFYEDKDEEKENPALKRQLSKQRYTGYAFSGMEMDPHLYRSEN